jgi:hypothetical protein
VVDFSHWHLQLPGVALDGEAEDPSQVDALQPCRCDAPDQLGRHDLAPMSPAVEHGPHLRGVPGHHDVGQQAERIGHGLHLIGTPRLSCRDTAGVDRALERVHGLAAVEHPAKLAPEGGVDKVVGQERRPEQLAELQLESWLKTSGGKGLHVVVPLAPEIDYEDVKGWSQAVVTHMARTIPNRFVAKSGGTNRVGKIFIDYLRNGHGRTTAAAFSARSRPGLGVSMPVSWDQLMQLKGGAQWTIATAREYVSFEKVDPWQGYWANRQSLDSAMEALGYRTKKKPASGRPTRRSSPE